MKIAKKDLKQSTLYKSLRNTMIRSNGVLLFITPVFWLLFWYVNIIFIFPAVYFTYRLIRDLIKGFDITVRSLCELDEDEFAILQKQALDDQNRTMFGTVTDQGLIVQGSFIPYNSIYDLNYQPKKWRWDALLMGIGPLSSPATLCITYAIEVPSGLKMNKKLKNLPTNRDISSEIEEFSSLITSRSKNKISVHNEYHFVK